MLCNKYPDDEALQMTKESLHEQLKELEGGGDE
jgi:hypothetical protein